MIALATLAALGEAIQIGVISLAALGGLVLLALAAVVVGVLVASRGPQGEPQHLDSALHGPPSATEEELMKAIRAQGLIDEDENGSGL